MSIYIVKTRLKHACLFAEQLRHFCIPSDQVLRDAEYIYVVLPYCHGGELFRVVSVSRGISEERARPMFRGLLDGMAFLHSLQICHRCE